MENGNFTSQEEQKVAKVDQGKSERFKKTEQIFESLDKVVDIQDKQEQESAMQKIIDKRLAELHEESPKKQETFGTRSVTGEFIHPDTEIIKFYGGDRLKLNDPDAYKSLLQAFSDFRKAWKIDTKKTTMQSIDRALGIYFGNTFSSNSTLKENIKFYSDHTHSESDSVNLSELKGKGIAVCAEKASLAHNYLKFLGIDSKLVSSLNCRFTEGNNDSHAYNLISTKNGEFLYDPSNPVIIRDAQNEILTTNATVYPISREDYDHLSQQDGKQVKVEHMNQKFIDGKYQKEDGQDRIYG